MDRRLLRFENYGVRFWTDFKYFQFFSISTETIVKNSLYFLADKIFFSYASLVRDEIGHPGQDPRLRRDSILVQDWQP